MKRRRKTGYGKRLSDPRWQRRRLEVLERDSWRCTWCGEGREELQVHHGYYERGRVDPWEYDMTTLYSLCDNCHERAENARASVYRRLRSLHPRHHLDVWQLLGQVEQLLKRDERALQGASATLDDKRAGSAG